MSDYSDWKRSSRYQNWRRENGFSERNPNSIIDGKTTGERTLQRVLLPIVIAPLIVKGVFWGGAIVAYSAIKIMGSGSGRSPKGSSMR